MQKGLRARLVASYCLSVFSMPCAGSKGSDIEKDLLSAIKPDYAVVQAAGYQGFLGLGFGYLFNPRFKLLVTLGGLPGDVGGSALSMITVKGLIDFVGLGSYSLLRPRLMVGLAAQYGHHPNLWIRLPEHYEREYYKPTAFRYFLSLGLHFPLTKKNRFYIDWSWHDSEIRRFMESTASEPITHTGSLGVGFCYGI